MYNLSWEDIYFNTSIRGLTEQFFPLYSKKDCCAYGGIAKWSNAADCKSVPSGSMVQIHVPPPLLMPRSQVVRHQTLTLTFRWFESIRGNQFICICPVSSVGRAFDF